MCQEKQEDLFNRLIMQDETCLRYIIMIQGLWPMQSKQWTHEGMCPALGSKVMLTVFGASNGVVMMDFMAKATITGISNIPRFTAAEIVGGHQTERHGMLTRSVHLLQDNSTAHNLQVLRWKHTFLWL